MNHIQEDTLALISLTDEELNNLQQILFQESRETDQSQYLVLEDLQKNMQQHLSQKIPINLSQSAQDNREDKYQNIIFQKVQNSPESCQFNESIEEETIKDVSILSQLNVPIKYDQASIALQLLKRILPLRKYENLKKYYPSLNKIQYRISDRRSKNQMTFLNNYYKKQALGQENNNKSIQKIDLNIEILKNFKQQKITGEYIFAKDFKSQPNRQFFNIKSLEQLKKKIVIRYFWQFSSHVNIYKEIIKEYPQIEIANDQFKSITKDLIMEMYRLLQYFINELMNKVFSVKIYNLTYMELAMLANHFIHHKNRFKQAEYSTMYDLIWTKNHQEPSIPHQKVIQFYLLSQKIIKSLLQVNNKEKNIKKAPVKDISDPPQPQIMDLKAKQFKDFLLNEIKKPKKEEKKPEIPIQSQIFMKSPGNEKIFYDIQEKQITINRIWNAQIERKFLQRYLINSELISLRNYMRNFYHPQFLKSITCIALRKQLNKVVRLAIKYIYQYINECKDKQIPQLINLHDDRVKFLISSPQAYRLRRVLVLFYLQYSNNQAIQIASYIQSLNFNIEKKQKKQRDGDSMGQPLLPFQERKVKYMYNGRENKKRRQYIRRQRQSLIEKKKKKRQNVYNMKESTQNIIFQKN